MIETLFYLTGLLVWVVGAIVVSFCLPIVGAFAVGYPAYRVKEYIEGRYYGNVEAVEQAKADDEWYYYVGHYALLIRDYAIQFVEWYLDKTVDRVL